MKMARKRLVAALAGAAFVAGVQLTVAPQAAEAKVKAKSSQYAVSVALKPTDQAGMVDQVYATADPTSDQYRKYLTPRDVADKYGRSGSDINQFKRYFKKYHVQANPYAGNLFLKVKGSYGNVKRAFHAKLSKHRTVYKLPSALKRQVSSVIGLVGTRKALLQAQGFKLKTKIDTSGQTPALTGQKSTFSEKYGPAKFADQYQLDKVYERQLTGKGQRIGLVAAADFYKSDVQKYLKQNGLATDVSRIHKIYLGSKKASQYTMSVDASMQAEVTLDVEQAASVAPGADVDVYIYPEADKVMSPDMSLLHTFNAAISDNLDKQLSTSIAMGNEVTGLGSDLSETKQQYSAAYNQAFEQAALQGITVFNASGDSGPYSAVSAKFNQDMMTSPYEVSVGGTTLPFEKIENGHVVHVKKERAWGNIYNINPLAKFLRQPYPAGGGGFSRLNATPRYQVGVPGVNTFTAIKHLQYKKKGVFKLSLFGHRFKIPLPAYFKVIKNPQLIHGTGTGRNLPDIAGNADPDTGYGLCLTAAHSKKEKGQTVWQIAGGTSATAPQMAAASAVMNSGLSQPAGFWNPQIYKYAQASDSPFTPLNDTFNNDNLYYAGTPGTLYNQATGLGTVNFDQLYTKFKG
ncbi:peptidase S53 propeptide [Secundilactobacillus kimchicus JCM 15530]|uniref:Peptidase S53 propeptide n=1 Tax=Secundilactobacillus kimchicus JCM 15530 TaxID=1302272 RepID=A0A0R1HL86_9LACO|nr:S53 family peptidase [Secundilactobacillus kimchicus]KRK47502.1 peptidase S53 propeptide [Secundilactobacillus kimchicus JCM 15530]